MDENNKELIINKHSLTLSDDNTIYITPSGSIKWEDAIKIRESILKFLDKVNGKVNIITDLNKVGKSTLGMKRIGMKIYKDERVKKVAFFGKSLFAEMISSFVMGLLEKEDIRFFKTMEEALAWLNEKD